MEIFRNLKNKRGGSRLGSNDVRVLDNSSDHDMAADIVQPMGEVIQSFCGDDNDSNEEVPFSIDPNQ